MLLPITFSFLISTSYYCSGNRVERVLHGTRVLGRKGPYDAVQYMAGIGSMHGVPFYTAGFHEGLKDTGVYGTINCGGALLTPSIMQTACHCVATFDRAFFPRRARVNLHWESIRVAYIGINDRFGEPFSMLTRPPVKSLKFFTHKFCEKLQKGTTQQGISHDYGYIKIDPSWISGHIGVPTTNVKFAPLYKAEELSRIYRSFLKNPPVCLNLGYGIFNDEGRPSDFIRAGWTHLVSDYWCEKYTCVNMTKSEISKYKSWVCAEEFPKHYQPVYKGDSGSPFTCNNAYFGVASASLKQTMGSKERRIGTYSALFFAAYQNAMEYRAGFEEEIIKWNTDTYVDIVRKVIGGLVGARMGEITCKYSKFNTSSITRWFAEETASATSSNMFHVPSGLVLLLITLPFT